MPRGDAWKRNRTPVVAYTRTGTIWFPTIDDCCKYFGIQHHETLKRMMESGQVGPDGYTTFDDPVPGWKYNGMND